jgi:hypothetical protein
MPFYRSHIRNVTIVNSRVHTVRQALVSDMQHTRLDFLAIRGSTVGTVADMLPPTHSGGSNVTLANISTCIEHNTFACECASLGVHQLLVLANHRCDTGTNRCAGGGGDVLRALSTARDCTMRVRAAINTADRTYRRQMHTSLIILLFLIAHISRRSGK